MGATSTNSLAASSSAYLRSAMHQPIHWHEWGEEAFAQARKENKPVLLDIGAVWCHWCHVMDRESYESPKIASVVNQHFIAIKVDRDERPDVDSRYQAAVAALSGQGGWPLTVFLTPEGKPFYGGTYFPPEDGFGRPGYGKLLVAVADAFREKREEVETQAGNLMYALGRSEGLQIRSEKFSPRILDKMIESAVKLFDAAHGGFGEAPKFPHSAAIDLLIDRYSRTQNEQLGKVVNTTLEKMAHGGVYDQIAGGFHRYSVDERWCVPHFEKMAYDNSELVKNYAHAWQVTGNPFFAHIARDIMRWMDAWLSDRKRGGFYASQDADISLDDDGDHFTWTRDEARAVLSDDEFRIAALHWDIGETGEMHHNPAKNVLWVRASVEQIAAETGRAVAEVRSLIESARIKMYETRKQRPIPYIDHTIYTNWNALCISAYLQASRVLDTDSDGAMTDARRFALRSLDRLLAEAWNESNGLGHVIAYSDGSSGQGRVAGLLDDYAYTALACLDAYETTTDRKYLDSALAIADQMLARFYDDLGGGFFDTQKNSAAKALGALETQRKPFQDAPTPAGAPSAAIALFKLFALSGNDVYHKKAEETMEVFTGVAEQFGIFAGTYGIAATWLAHPHMQVVIVGGDETADALYSAAVLPFSLNKIVLRIRTRDFDSLPPSLSETVPNLPGIREGRSVAVVCTGFTCQPPVTDANELAQILRRLIEQG